jgi:pimeloyl-ACP methyl ester carboxylesterase
MSNENAVNEFQRPMQPWPGLEPHGRKAALPKNGLSLFYYEMGAPSAPALIMIHGLGDEADTWRHVIGPLSERYQVIALDLPGFGRSDALRARRSYSLTFLRDTLLELMDVLGFANATWMGHSLGAVIAQSAALEQPERVAQLFLVSGSLTTRAQKLNPVILQMSLPFLGARLYNSLRGQPQTAYETLRPYYANLDALPEADRRFLYQRVNERVWSDGQRDAFLSILRHLVWLAPGRQRAAEEKLARLKTPTHAIWGESDVINSVESGQALVSIQPTAKLTVIPNAGHNLHQERPEAFLKAVLS